MTIDNLLFAIILVLGIYLLIRFLRVLSKYFRRRIEISARIKSEADKKIL